MTIKIALVEPGEPGNIGAVARVMKNFGFKELILINPRTELTSDSYRMAMHAQDVLERTTIYKSISEFTKEVSFMVGTTAKLASDSGSTNARIAVSSDDPTLINLLELDGNVGILFGREDIGLKNKDLEFCDMTLHVPTSQEYPVLNLAQAVGIILYSLSTKKKNLKISKYRSANREDKEKMILLFEQLVSVLNYPKRKGELLVRRFRNIIGRAFISGKEANSLLGVFTRSYKLITKMNTNKNKKN